MCNTVFFSLHTCTRVAIMYTRFWVLCTIIIKRVPYLIFHGQTNIHQLNCSFGLEVIHGGKERWKEYSERGRWKNATCAGKATWNLLKSSLVTSIRFKTLLIIIFPHNLISPWLGPFFYVFFFYKYIFLLEFFCKRSLKLQFFFFLNWHVFLT